MKKSTFINYILFILFFSPVLHAQTTDSLANDYIKKGKDQLFSGKYDRAIEVFKKSLELYKSSKNRTKIPESYNLLSKAYLAKLELEGAMEYAKKALESSRLGNHENKLEEANALDNIGLVQGWQRRLESALKNHNEALQIRLKFYKEDNTGLCSSYLNIGLTKTLQGHYEEAFKVLSKALEIKLGESPKEKILLANLNQSIGHVYYLQSDFDNALVFYEKTLRLGKEVYEEDNHFFAKIYNSLGLIYSSKEQFNESLKYYQKALSISISNYGLDNHPTQIPLHFNMGDIYYLQNKKEKALFHTKKTLEMGIKVYGDSHDNLFYPYSRIGQIYGDERGIPYIEKALEICQTSVNNDFVRISFLYDYLSEIYVNIKNYPKALEFAQKALKIRSDLFGAYNANSIRSHNILSKIHLALNNYENALSHNESGIAHNYLNKKDAGKLLTDEFTVTKHLDTDLLLESIKIKADILLNLYHEHQKEEYLKKSLRYYEKAVSLIELIRKKNRNYDDKIRFSGIVKSIYAKNIETNLLLENQRNTISSNIVPFYYSEKSRANTLRELATNIDAKKKSNIDSGILDIEKSIDSEVARITSEVIKEKSNQKIDSVKLYRLEGKLLDLSLKKDSLEKKIESDFPKYYRLKYENKIITVAELQGKLNDSATLVEFFRSEGSVYTFIVTKTSFHIKTLTIADLDEKIQQLNKSIIAKDQPKFIQTSFNLYEELIAPVREYFEGDKLIIIPDESLWHIPFDLLLMKDGKNDTSDKLSYLLYDYAISYANSASLLFKEFEKTELLDQCIAFSYTNQDSIHKNSNTISLTTLRNSDVDLPGTREEIKEISKIFDGKYYYGEDANELNFKENAAKYKLVHLALHGDIDHNDPKNLKIYFSDKENEKEDNKLYGHELYALNVPADLVVLSACNTGSGGINNGEGIISLGNAFQYAGAQSLLLSRWEISDKTTPTVMKYFYKNLKKGMDKSSALRKAKLDFLKNADHFNSVPFYWGSFYILGNDEAISFTTSNTRLWVIFSVVLFVFISLFYLKKYYRRNN